MGFLKAEVKFTVYADAAQTVFPQRVLAAIDELLSTTTNAAAEVLYIPLAAAAGQTVNLNGVTAVKGLYVFSDTNDVNVNINGLGDVPYTALWPSFFGAQATSLVVTNNIGSTATNVVVVVIRG